MHSLRRDACGNVYLARLRTGRNRGLDWLALKEPASQRYVAGIQLDARNTRSNTVATSADDPITANMATAVTNPTLCQKRFKAGLRVLAIGA